MRKLGFHFALGILANCEIYWQIFGFLFLLHSPHYLPNCMTTVPYDAQPSSFTSEFSTSSNPMMTSPSPYLGTLPQRHSTPEYTPSHPTFHPQYMPDYQQPYFRHYAPPQPLVPVSHLHVSYTPGFQLMQLWKMTQLIVHHSELHTNCNIDIVYISFHDMFFTICIYFR
jgi:hypothetical protein